MLLLHRKETRKKQGRDKEGTREGRKGKEGRKGGKERTHYCSQHIICFLPPADESNPSVD